MHFLPFALVTLTLACFAAQNDYLGSTLPRGTFFRHPLMVGVAPFGALAAFVLAFWLLPWWGVFLAGIMAAFMARRICMVLGKLTPPVCFVSATVGLVIIYIYAMFSAIPGEDRDCADFSTHAQAQRFYEQAQTWLGEDPHGLDGEGEDPHGLDGEGDGRACESLP